MYVVKNNYINIFFEIIISVLCTFELELSAIVTTNALLPGMLSIHRK